MELNVSSIVVEERSFILDRFLVSESDAGECIRMRRFGEQECRKLCRGK